MRFEAYLKEKHVALFPELLDDELPAAFESWLSNLTVEEWLTFADEILAMNANEVMPYRVPSGKPLRMWIN